METPPFDADAFAKALFGDRLSKDEKFIELLDDEQWCSTPLQPINPETAPAYYVDMTRHERENHQIRIEFANTGYFKKNKLNPPTLDTLSKFEGWGGLAVPETQRLYEIPGVKRALELYVELIDSDRELGKRKADGTSYSLRTAKNRNEVLVGRKQIRKEIEESVANGYKNLANSGDFDEKEIEKFEKRGLNKMSVDTEDTQLKTLLELKCREAEQIAFVINYIGGIFESLDSKWVSDTRVRNPETMSDLVNVPIKIAMNPLDNLVDSLKKSPAEVSVVGAFGEWAHNMIFKANGGVAPKSIERVEIVSEEIGYENKFWTFDPETKTIFAPECYPKKLVRSIWEETTVKDKDTDTDRELIDYLRKKQEIPWDEVTGGMWPNYASKLGKAGVIWDLLQGKNIIKWGEFENVGQWIQDANNALAKFGLRKEESIKRWVLYASAGGVNPSERAPKLRIKGRKLEIHSSLGPKMGNYLPWDKLLFPWDRRGFFA